MGKRKPVLDSINISGFEYEVRYNQDLADEGLMGRILLLQQVIELRPDMSILMEWHALLHEYGHGLLWHAGIKEHDERLLDINATGFAALLYTKSKKK